MLDRIRHFFKTREKCKGFCPTCEHYKKCKEDLSHERNMG